jgi:outer membrane beta-barrel protein
MMARRVLPVVLSFLLQGVSISGAQEVPAQGPPSAEVKGPAAQSGVTAAPSDSAIQQTTTQAPATPRAAARPLMTLDRGLKPGSSDEVSSLFENVVAVQRKAKQKSGKFLLAPLFSFDFSDSPFTMYGLNLSFGYALGEFWEIYLTYTPAFAANERNISKKVKELTLANGDVANIETERAKSYYGVDVNWVPIYGKDSWGPYGIVRSDTFLNFSAGQVKYEVNSGLKYKFALGKTFFFSDHFNFRVQAGPSLLDTFSKGVKQSIFFGLIEVGTVFYF